MAKERLTAEGEIDKLYTLPGYVELVIEGIIGHDREALAILPKEYSADLMFRSVIAQHISSVPELLHLAQVMYPEEYKPTFEIDGP